MKLKRLTYFKFYNKLLYSPPPKLAPYDRDAIVTNTNKM